MKMAPGVFWGLFLILIGIALVMKVIFRMDIPVGKVVFALFFILIGFKLLFSDFSFKRYKTGGNDVIFGEMYIKGVDMKNDEYDIIFGKGTFDLRDIDLVNMTSNRFKIACVFGGVDIIINDTLPIKITSESVFAGGRFPDGNSTAFGTSTYVSPNYDPLKPHLNLKLEMVFGGANVVTKETGFIKN